MLKKTLLFTTLAVGLLSCTKTNTRTECIGHQRPDTLRTVTDYVDPFIGTGGHGHTFPGATLPFGMVQLSPDTRLDGWDGCGGYHYSDSVLYGFSHTHLSGTGCSDYGDVLIMPFSGDLRNGDYHPSKHYTALFSHATEEARPGYYAVELNPDSIKAELTATLRTGWHRYTYPAGKSGSLLIDLKHRDKVIASSIALAGNNQVEGYRRSANWASDQHIYFVAEFSSPVVKAEIAVNDSLNRELTHASGTNLKMFLNFGNLNGQPLVVKVGISAVSIEGARQNLRHEAASYTFDDIRSLADTAWTRELSRITVEGGSDQQKTIFYTALYHSFIAPNLFTDADGQYRGRDLQVHQADSFTNYTVFSLWDTYRAAHPLFTLVQKKRTTDFIRTFLAQYKQGGLLPVWELAGNETNCMIGYHAVPVIADAFVKGIGGYDAKEALEAMQASATQDHFGLKYYRERGYIPSEEEGESVSRTLEYAYDDWCIARVAKALNNDAVFTEYIKRAQNYKNLFDPATHFMRARNNDAWFAPFDPREVNFNYTEANCWQYSFYVPHDVDGLIKLHGGDEAFASKLDELFTTASETTGRDQADITGLIGQYAHGNEPSHHMAYLYSYAGKPWKTQQRVRQIMDEMYTTCPDGLIGNEDCGQMSAWLVMSAMGIYPVTPASDVYVFGTPWFEKVSIHFENGETFTMKAPDVSAPRCYIQGAKLNGKTYERSWISHFVLEKGGELEFAMGPEPNPAYGKDETHRPISKIHEHPIEPVPFVAKGQRTFTDTTLIEIKSLTTTTLHYTTDGTLPTPASPVFSKPLIIKESTTLQAISVNKQGVASQPLKAFFYKIAHNHKLKLQSKFEPQYAAGGENALADGLRGGHNFRTGRWQGFQGINLEAVMDLGEKKKVTSIVAGFMQDQGAWIFMPSQVTYYASDDMANWSPIAELKNDIDPRNDGVVLKDFSVKPQNLSARYIRMVAENPGPCPSWHLGAGGKSWIFADEWIVE
ncbi:MAG: GH92 family glycosyl hydrolase [Bacteroidales bacterium]|nr:GH92 family glycosyl hydrolase [Bacteroidales bacterium]